MALPGMFLALIIWYIAGKPNTEPLETLICNVIPMISIALGLVFGWLTGGEYEGGGSLMAEEFTIEEWNKIIEKFKGEFSLYN